MPTLGPRRAAALLLPLFLALAPASAQEAAAGPAPAEAGGAPAPAPRLAILVPASLRQGDPLLAWIIEAVGEPAGDSSPAPKLEARLLDAAGKTAARAACFEATPLLGPEPARARLYGAIVGLPQELSPGAYTLAISGPPAALDPSASARGGAAPRAALAESPIGVAARDFPVETIPLDAANTAIKTVPSKRKDDEARRLYDVLGRVDSAALFADGSPFLFPVEGGFRSAGFGDKRRYVYPKGGSDTSSHAGIDWAVLKGTAVRACERGKVVLVADREVTGKTIVLEHLPGLYSLYFHLSSVAVSEGATAERGDTIARSGSTGMSTGPHLHWELRAGGLPADPEYWLASALLDKEAIKAKITALIEGR